MTEPEATIIFNILQLVHHRNAATIDAIHHRHCITIFIYIEHYYLVDCHFHTLLSCNIAIVDSELDYHPHLLPLHRHHLVRNYD